MVKKTPIIVGGRDDHITDERATQAELFTNALSDHVQQAYIRAAEHKASHNINERYVDNLRYFVGKYSADELSKYGIEISKFRNISAMIALTAVSWLEDAYTYVGNKPWTINPTPIVDLPEDIQKLLDEAKDIRLAQLQEAGVIPGDMKTAVDVIQALEVEAQEMAFKQAQTACKAMSKKIEDQFAEGEWRGEFEKFKLDVAIYPTAFFKSPVIRMVSTPRWKGSSIEFEEKAVMFHDRVLGTNMFPSPDSTNCQDGEYIIERMTMTHSQMATARGLEGYSKTAIELVMHDNSEGTRDSERKVSQWEEDYLQVKDSEDRNLYVVYDFWGRVSGRTILEFMAHEGLAVEAENTGAVVRTDWGDIDPFDSYALNVWTCGGYVIRAMLNPSPMGDRPYQCASYVKVPDSIWGRSPIDMTKDCQDELNAAIRSRIYNMGMASGPIVEVDVDRISKSVTELPKQIRPWMTVYTEGGNQTSAPAIRFNQASSNSGELTAVAQECWEKAHDLAGLPPYTRGSEGGTHRTLGGFTMQYNNSAKGIKRVIGYIDTDVIEPIVKRLYYYNLVYDEDESIKADANVSAMGVRGFLIMEKEQAKPMETLQSIAPVASNNPQIAQQLLSEFFVTRGYDPDKMGLPGGTFQRNIIGGTGSPGTASAPDLGVPSLDGRSSPATESINASQIPFTEN